MRKISELMNRFFPYLITVGLLTGILLGERIVWLSSLVPLIFGFVTFVGSLNMNFDSFKKTVTNPKPILTVLFVLRILMPLWALLVGNIVFSSDVYTITGLLLFAVIPTGVNSAVWTVMYKGNISLSLSVILLDTLLSPFIVPLSLAMLTGANIEMDAAGMMINLIQMVVIPSLLGMGINQITKGKVTEKWSPKLMPFSKIGLIAVVIINGATVAPHFATIDFKLILIMCAVLFLVISGHVISWLTANVVKLKREDVKATVFSGGMRNVSTGIVIAVTHFPSEVAVPVICGILFQQIVSSVFGGLMERHYEKIDSETNLIGEKIMD